MRTAAATSLTGLIGKNSRCRRRLEQQVDGLAAAARHRRRARTGSRGHTGAQSHSGEYHAEGGWILGADYYLDGAAA